MSKILAPGRLGNPEMTFSEDPRADPRLAAAMAMMELASGVDTSDADADLETALACCQAWDDLDAQTHPALWDAMPSYDEIDSTIQVIKGVDDNDITLSIERPKNQTGKLPGVLHIHGGGMVISAAADPMYVRWRKSAAQLGLVVVGVEFRNGGGKLGNHPFPAGLNDCAEAAKWVLANKEELGISNLVISGESGGGNLSIAVTLKAHQEGWSNQIAGVYAMCPYISGAYTNPPRDLISLVENDTYMLDRVDMSVCAMVYDPTGENAKNPLAWPHHATVSELRGLPAHVISVNELDPLRDEGLQFYRKLMAAEVAVMARTVHGTPHGAELGFHTIAPEITTRTLESLYQFANSVRSG